MPAENDAVTPLDPAADRRVHLVETIISYVLRIGVTTSLAVVILGCVVGLARHPAFLLSPDALQELTGKSAVFPHSLTDVATGVREMRGQAVIAAGLLLLILTPVMRVAVSIFAFIYQKDRVFTLITTVVLIILLFSFVLGHAQ
jgi:uncharacterized membrane protein